MNFIKSLQLSILLLRIKKDEVNKHVHHYQKCLPDGTLVDIYQNIKKELSLWILVHGMTNAGPRHPRLIHFAYTLANEGLTCIVPKLSGLSACRWEADDLKQLIEVISYGSNQINAQVGLIGFSYGGSYSLIAASRKEMMKKIRRVISFGAYYNLIDLIDSYLKDFHQQPANDIQWQEEVYRYMAFMYGYGDKSLLPPAAWEEMKFILERYSYSTSLKEKQLFYRRYLQRLDISTLLKRSLDNSVLASLSPAGNISGICFPVTLIHAKDDFVVPSSHAGSLYSELQHSAASKKHQLVLTSVLSHVTPKSLKIGEMLKLLNAFAPLKEKPKLEKN